MPQQLIHYIVTYGYLSVFLLIFLQEIGLPSFPNELLLIYVGYLAGNGILNIFFVVFIAVAADCFGTFTLYILFYFFAAFIIRHKPKWIPVPHKAIHSVKAKIINGNHQHIFIGRLIPYVRGYTSIAAGMCRIDTRRYIITIFCSAVLWSGGFVMIGWIACPYWVVLSKHFNWITNYLLIIQFVLLLFIAVKHISKKYLIND